MALSVNTGSGLYAQGSNLTTTQVQRVLVQPLQAASVFLSSGVNIIDSASPVRLPIAPDASNTFSFVAEGGSIPEANPTFDELTLLPTTMQSIKIISRFTRELLAQSVVAIDAALQSNLVQSVAATLDTAFVAGDGDGTTAPTGLLNFADAQTMAAVGTISIDDLYDAVNLALVANVPLEGLVWYLRPETLTALRKLKASTAGTYLLQPDPTQAGALTLLGIPVTVTTRIPTATVDTTTTTSAVLWAPRFTTVIRDTSPTVQILTELYAGTDEIGIKVGARYDVGCAKQDSVILLQGVTV